MAVQKKRRQNIRYFAGKGQDESESDSSSENEQTPNVNEENKTVRTIHVQVPLELPANVENISDVGDTESQNGEKTTEENEASESAFESSEESDESEQELRKKSLLRKPVFVLKANKSTEEVPSELAQDECMKQQRHLTAHSMVEAIIQQEAKETKAAETEELLSIDDTDGLDPDYEYAAWQLRELNRIKRDRELLVAQEEERRKIERRREMDEDVRLKEDLEYVRQQRENKHESQMRFGQKWHHKGAFYLDDEEVFKRDTSAPAEDDVVNRKALPTYLQRHNAGRTGATKWTHLANEDTTKEGSIWGGHETSWPKRPRTDNTKSN